MKMRWRRHGNLLGMRSGYAWGRLTKDRGYTGITNPLVRQIWILGSHHRSGAGAELDELSAAPIRARQHPG